MYLCNSQLLARRKIYFHRPPAHGSPNRLSAYIVPLCTSGTKEHAKAIYSNKENINWVRKRLTELRLENNLDDYYNIVFRKSNIMRASLKKNQIL